MYVLNGERQKIVAFCRLTSVEMVCDVRGEKAVEIDSGKQHTSTSLPHSLPLAFALATNTDNAVTPHDSQLIVQAQHVVVCD